MPALTPQFIFDFESNMKAITENEYARFASNMWWSKIMRTRPTGSRKEIVAWLLSTAKIENLEKFGGKVPFEDLVATYTTFEPAYAGAGLKLRRAQLEDLDGNGIDLAGKWSSDIGAYMGYWPQKNLITAIKNGATAGNNSYDGVTFFNTAHPVNPFNTAAGNYANLFTGAASGVYPGACPIDDSVTLDVAITNFAKVLAYVRSIKMPNGEDPRFLRSASMVVSPRLAPRALQLTNAKIIAQAAAGGAGSADVEAIIKYFGFPDVIVSDEMAGFESDTTWFLGCEELSSSQLGGFVYVDREPFAIRYYTGTGGGTGIDAILDRADELEWHCKGRNVVGYGHPYAFHKVKAT